MFKIEIANENEMLRFGETLSQAFSATGIVFLYGELGAGKTTLVRGFLRGLGFAGHVKSPTYTLVETYHLENKTLHHFDLYRLHHPDELIFLGIRDYFQPNTMCLLEWPDRASDFLPTPDVECRIEFAEDGRKITLIPQTDQGKKLLERAFKDE